MNYLELLLYYCCNKYIFINKMNWFQVIFNMFLCFCLLCTSFNAYRLYKDSRKEDAHVELVIFCTFVVIFIVVNILV